MVALIALVAAASMAVCPGPKNQVVDVTSIIDPAIVELAEDYASVALARPHTDFAYSNISLNGDNVFILFLYKDGTRFRQFSVSVNVHTWERTHVLEE